MSARRARIRARNKHFIMAVVESDNFQLDDWQEVQAELVIMEPEYSLYCLNLDLQQAFFVKTPADHDITGAPFLFQEEYFRATRNLALDFETFHQLPQKILLRNREDTIHSIGRPLWHHFIKQSIQSASLSL